MTASGSERGAKQRIAERWGRWRCSRGHHRTPLTWMRPKERPVPIDSQPMEMLVASGFARSFMQWAGWCERCQRAVEWASYDPRSAADRRVANLARRARKAQLKAIEAPAASPTPREPRNQ